MMTQRAWPLSSDPAGVGTAMIASSLSFRDKLILSVFSQVAVCSSGSAAYDLSPRCGALQAEELVQFLLLAGELGGHAADPGPAAGGGVDQHGLFDGGELAQ